jgi:hypothetical protein
MRRQIVSLLPLVAFASAALGQAATPDPSPQVTGQATAADSQIILNEVNTSRFLLIEIFATVLKDGKPQKGLTAADFRVREDEVDQGPLNVEAKLPPLSVVITLDNSGSMKPRMLKALYDRIGEQLAGQYLITYSSNLPGDGSPHQVQVKYGDLASSKEYQSPQLVESSSPSSTITAATPVPKRTAEKPKKESTAVTLGGIQNILESTGITVKKDGKEFSVGSDGISIKDGNPGSSPADSARPNENQSPDWIPIPDGGSISSQTVIGDDTGRIALTVRRPESEIRNFYRGQFTQKGWNITELHHGGSGTLIATGDGKRVQIAVTEQSSGDTLVAINYSAD